MEFTISAEDERDALEAELNISSSNQMADQIAFIIWSAVASTTKGFGKVEINIDPKSQRVFIKITPRWWAKSKKLEALRKYWLAKAERKTESFIPSGWKSLYYYKRENDERSRHSNRSTENI